MLTVFIEYCDLQTLILKYLTEKKTKVQNGYKFYVAMNINKQQRIFKKQIKEDTSETTICSYVRRNTLIIWGREG